MMNNLMETLTILADSDQELFINNIKQYGLIGYNNLPQSEIIASMMTETIDEITELDPLTASIRKLAEDRGYTVIYETDQNRRSFLKRMAATAVSPKGQILNTVAGLGKQTTTELGRKLTKKYWLHKIIGKYVLPPLWNRDEIDIYGEMNNQGTSIDPREMLSISDGDLREALGNLEATPENLYNIVGLMNNPANIGSNSKIPEWLYQRMIDAVNKMVRQMGAKKALYAIASRLEKYTAPHVIRDLQNLANISPTVAALFKNNGLSNIKAMNNIKFNKLEELTGVRFTPHHRKHYANYRQATSQAGRKRTQEQEHKRKQEQEYDKYALDRWADEGGATFESKLNKALKIIL